MKNLRKIFIGAVIASLQYGAAFAAPATNTVEMRQYNGTGWVPLQLTAISNPGLLQMSGGVPSFSTTPSTVMLSISGTAGTGYVDFLSQSSDPSSPAINHGSLWIDSSRFLSFQAQGGSKAAFNFSNLTGARNYVWPNMGVSVMGSTSILADKQIPFASGTQPNQQFAGDADLTFLTDTLSATKVAMSSLTSGRVPFSTTAGLLIDDANLTYVTGSGSLIVPQIGVGSGTTAPVSALQIVDISTASPRGILSDQYNNGTNSAQINQRKARGTFASPLTIVTGDVLSRILTWGHDGTNFIESGNLRFTSGGTIAATRVPSQFEVWTSTDATPSVLTKNLVVGNTGNLLGMGPLNALNVVDGITPYTELEVDSTSSTSPRGIMTAQFSTDANGARFYSRKGRGTRASPTTVANSDVLGRWAVEGYDGSNYLEMGGISVQVNGTVAATKVPTQMIFQTATNATPSVLTTAFTLNSSQQATFTSTVGASGFSTTGTGTTQFGSTANATIGVSSNANTAGILQVIAPATGSMTLNAQGVAITLANATSTGIRFNGYGAGALTTDASGNITASSDEKLKNIQRSYTRGLVDLQKLHPITYKWKEGTGLETEHEYSGFGANDVKDAIPEAVGMNPDGTLTLQDRAIIAALVNSVKELQAEIDAIKK